MHQQVSKKNLSILDMSNAMDEMIPLWRKLSEDC